MTKSQFRFPLALMGLAVVACSIDAAVEERDAPDTPTPRLDASTLQTTNDAVALAEALLGGGDAITITSASYHGASTAAGTYADGPQGLGTGAMLTTGLATNSLPPNDAPHTSRNHGLAGDSLCASVAPGQSNHDGARLSITFDLAPGYDGISILSSFGSEEYPEYVGSAYNDVFAIFLDGQQIAFDAEGEPITINGPFFGSDDVVLPPASGTEYDGSTPVLQTRAPLRGGSGGHRLDIVICDGADAAYDSGVFLAGLNGCVGNQCTGTIPCSAIDADGDGIDACTDCDDTDPEPCDGAGEGLLCEATQWRTAVPAAGDGLMAYQGRAYLFGSDGLNWTIVSDGAAQVGPIPRPAGVASMRTVRAEIAPSGRPLVAFQTNNQWYAAFFDGRGFVRTTAVGGSVAHADASERIYVQTSTGLVEYGPGAAPLHRGTMPHSGNLWGVDAAGTVYVFHSRSRPSTIHPGDTAIDLLVTRLPHGSLTWSADSVVGSNEGQGFGGLRFAAAPDGSVHLAYRLTYGGIYFRSRDGIQWESDEFMDILSEATLVDVAQTSFDDDPREVKGQIRSLFAQSYDDASIALVHYGGSLGVSGFYFLRRCAPFVGSGGTWPAERLAFSGQAFDQGRVALDERGLANFLTPNGMRQSALPND